MKISDISTFFGQQKRPFLMEKNYLFGSFKAQLYAYRRFNMLGRDYIFVHEGSQADFQSTKCEAMHEAARAHVSAQYRRPKILRFVVPNVVSVFLSSDGFSNDTLQLVNTPGRDWKGGECHAYFFIDSSSHQWFGPGFHTVQYKGGNYTFKGTDPTNRSIELVKVLMK